MDDQVHSSVAMRIKVAVMGLLVVAAGGAMVGRSATSSPERIQVVYAGSLAAVMEDNIAPTFEDLTGIRVAGEAHGSLGAAQLIRDGLRAPDVFVSADPLVNQEILMGAANHDLLDWYITFAASDLVLGFAGSSAIAKELEKVATGERPWFEVLSEPGVTFGRGDPSIDPKGYRTIMMFELASMHYRDPRIAKLIGDPMNARQVFPEVSLLGRVQSGQLDAGFFYRHEAVASGLNFIELPDAVNLGSPAEARTYAKVDFRVPGSGTRVTGAPIVFTVGIPSAARHPEAASEFAAYLLSNPASLEDLGFGAITPELVGEISAVPVKVRKALDAREAGL